VKRIAPGPGFGMAKLPRTCDGNGAEQKVVRTAHASIRPIPDSYRVIRFRAQKCPVDPFQILPDSSLYLDQQRCELGLLCTRGPPPPPRSLSMHTLTFA
jgi:hypothetical protein